jgi:trehalose synthase
MHEIAIEPVGLDRLGDLLPDERRDQVRAVAAEARDLLAGRVVWNVNATAHGGGVAEMLQTLLAYVRAAEVDTRWLVLTGSPAFFRITKRLHNRLHGQPGDGGPLGRAESSTVAATLRPDLEELSRAVRRDDIVILHDPQPAGLLDGLRELGAHVVWRCHVGRDTPNELSNEGWAFLRPLVEKADGFVFSRRAYAPDWAVPDRLHVITPSIDPSSAKNCSLGAEEVRSALTRSGLLEGEAGSPHAGGFTRRDGTAGVVRSHTDLVVSGTRVPADARLVVQVSRWDHLKDMLGVLHGFALAAAALPDDVHLVLAGPDVSGVTDDPEGAEVLARCRSAWDRLEPPLQRRVHLVCLPMDDVDENAHLVNALQRRATVIVQKSLVEGFGLTVTEAMWKGRPVIASAVGGVNDQIVDGREGVLLEDPSDLAAFADALRRLLDDPDLAARLGASARERVYGAFLADRHLEAYVDLFSTLL